MTTENSQKKLKIKCPHCGHLIFYDVSVPFRPFCSERCRLLDLGAWANEEYKIPLEGQELLDPNSEVVDPDDEI